MSIVPHCGKHSKKDFEAMQFHQGPPSPLRIEKKKEKKKNRITPRMSSARFNQLPSLSLSGETSTPARTTAQLEKGERKQLNYPLSDTDMSLRCRQS